jgi:DNA invertase Pin-like site-specific DNA recombinase
MSTLAYSYVRFSSKKQAGGDSVRRQTDGRAEDYCRRKGWTLSAATYRDLGVSAWKGKNALVGNLGEILKAIQSRAVRSGSALIVESLDRITRQGIDEGYDLVKRILKAGVRIVTLSPEREFDAESVRSLSKGSLEIQIILERAAEESEIKSKRGGAAWDAKKARARRGEAQHPRREGKYGGRTLKALTARLPAWVRLDEAGDMELIEEKALGVRRVFELAAAGYGLKRIVARLEADGVPPVAGRRWHRSYVDRVLRDRRALGEWQPRKKGGREPDGKAVPGYFPAVVDETLFYRARHGAGDRRRFKGRVGEALVNPFAGLLRNAAGDDAYGLAHRVERLAGGRSERYHVLVNRDADRGAAACRSFPYLPFERALLGRLREVKPEDVLAPGPGAAELDALEGEQKWVEDRIEALKVELLKGDVAAVADVLRGLETKLVSLRAQEEDARTRLAVTAEEGWAQVHSLTDLLDHAEDPDDLRLRLRGALRRVIDSVWLLVVRRRRDRLLATQVWFKDGGKHRDYLLFHRVPRGNQHGRGEARTEVLSSANVSELGPLDLRRRQDAEALEKALVSLPLPQ